MKRIALLLFLMPAILYSQNITGKIIDKNSREPVASPFIMLSTGENAVGTIDGEFAINASSFPAVRQPI
jgi:hypothetical protein